MGLNDAYEQILLHILMLKSIKTVDDERHKNFKPHVKLDSVVFQTSIFPEAATTE